MAIRPRAGGKSLSEDVVYFTDRGIEELAQRRGDEQVALSWLADRMRDFVDDHPEFEVAVERLATYLARDDSDDPEE
jgi:hypothetical protein